MSGQPFPTQSQSLTLILTPNSTLTLALTLVTLLTLASTLTLTATLALTLTLSATRSLKLIPVLTALSTPTGVDTAPGAGGGKQPVARGGEKKPRKHPLGLRVLWAGGQVGCTSSVRVSVCVCVCARVGVRIGVCVCV